MKSLSDSSVPLFSNEFVKCYSDYFEINLYYFPFGSKKVKYSNIRSCELYSMDELDMFDYKLWGMALSPIWWHCDMNRFSRKYYVLIDANQWPKIAITMDDNHIVQFCNFIRERIFRTYPSNNSTEKERQQFSDKS